MKTALGHFSLTHSKCSDTPKVPKGLDTKKSESEIPSLLLAFVLVGCIGLCAFLCEDVQLFHFSKIQMLLY